MNLFYISIRQLFQKNDYGFISFSIYSSILGITLGVSLLIIVDSFTMGFNKIIDDKLSKIDGHIRITNFSKNNQNIQLDSLFKNKNIIVNDFISNYVIASSNRYLENALLYSVKDNSLEEVFNLNLFIDSGDITLENDNDIIIGYKLAEILNLTLNEEIIIYNIDEIYTDKMFKARLFNITGIVKTGFPEYDKVLAFIKFDTANNSFNTSSASIGKIINYKDKFNLDLELKEIKSYLNPFHYNIQSWKERHRQLYEWLSVYSIPIYFVMISIITLAIFNILISLRLIIDKKKNNLAVLKSIGYSNKELCFIVVNQGIVISTIGSFIGALISICILNLQNKYKFISLSSDVYFISYLPASISYYNILIILISTIMITTFISYLASIKFFSFSPSEILRHE